MSKFSLNQPQISSYVYGSIGQLTDRLVAYLSTHQGTFYDDSVAGGKYYYQTNITLFSDVSGRGKWREANKYVVGKDYECPGALAVVPSNDADGFLVLHLRESSENKVAFAETHDKTGYYQGDSLSIARYSGQGALNSFKLVRLASANDEHISSSTIVPIRDQALCFYITESSNSQHVYSSLVDLASDSVIAQVDLTSLLGLSSNKVATEVSATYFPEQDRLILSLLEHQDTDQNSRIKTNSYVIDFDAASLQPSYQNLIPIQFPDFDVLETYQPNIPVHCIINTPHGERILTAISFNDEDQKGSDVKIILSSTNGTLLDSVSLQGLKYQRKSLLSFSDMTFQKTDDNAYLLELSVNDAAASMPSLQLNVLLHVARDSIRFKNPRLASDSGLTVASTELADGTDIIVTNKVSSSLSGGNLRVAIEPNFSDVVVKPSKLELNEYNSYLLKSVRDSETSSLNQTTRLSGVSSSNANGEEVWSPKTSFAVIGDYGNVFYNDLRPEASPATYVAAAVRKLQPDFIVSTGDDNYVEGKINWKDFNVGKLFAPYIQPYTVINDSSSGKKDAATFAANDYLGIPRKDYNRFFPLPGNHDVGLLRQQKNGRFLAGAANLTRSYSFDPYYQAALVNGSNNIRPLAYGYGGTFPDGSSYGSWDMSMPGEYQDYVLNPIDKNGTVLSDLANLYIVDRTSMYYQGNNMNPDTDLQARAIFEDSKNSVSRWNLFFSHYPTYSSELAFSNKKNEAGLAPSMDGAFNSNNIDLVIGAHVHNYERFSIDGKGHYIVNGNGGYNTFYTNRSQVWADYVDLGGAVWSALNWDLSAKPVVNGLVHADDAKFGFGWIDMDESRLVYSQYVLDLPLVKTGDLAGDALKVNGSIFNDYLKISDQLILEKGDSVKEYNVLTRYRLDPANGYGDVFVYNYENGTTPGGTINLVVDGPSINNNEQVTRIVLGKKPSDITLKAPYGAFVDDVQDFIGASSFVNSNPASHHIAFDSSADLAGQSLPLPVEKLEVLYRGNTRTIRKVAGSALAQPLHNYISTGSGSDTVIGSSLNDFLRTGAGSDDVVLGGGIDLVELGEGDDWLDVSGSSASLIIRSDHQHRSTYVITGWNSNDRVFLEQDLEVVSGLDSRQLILANQSGVELEINIIRGGVFSADLVLPL